MRPCHTYCCFNVPLPSLPTGVDAPAPLSPRPAPPPLLTLALRRFRKASGQSATVLLVRDTGGYVFGAFCPEVWRPNPRFFGTGETFVFQLAPHKVRAGSGD